ncbi:MAG: hypothetical protein PHW52_03575 [Candidatus Pacebacteria bacterium]|nr:hypothetical protein [Candidatus Paceibacterota bacterium]
MNFIWNLKVLLGENQDNSDLMQIVPALGMRKILKESPVRNIIFSDLSTELIKEWLRKNQLLDCFGIHVYSAKDIRSLVKRIKPFMEEDFNILITNKMEDMVNIRRVDLVFVSPSVDQETISEQADCVNFLLVKDAEGLRIIQVMGFPG